MATITNTPDFVKFSSNLYNNLYDYSKVNYINVKTKVTIGCPVHGDFEQTPSQHYRGKGCKHCLLDKSLAERNKPTHPKNIESTKEFISNCTAANPGKYYYEDTYKQSGAPVATIMTTVCTRHNIQCTASIKSYLKGYTACAKCKLEEVVARCKKIQDNRYTYNPNQEFINQTTKLEITCKTHGVFLQITNHHLLGKGCPKCATDLLRQKFTSSTDKFIAKAKAIHGDEYCYDASKIGRAHV